MPKVNRTRKRITDVFDRHLRRLVANEVYVQQSLLSDGSSSDTDLEELSVKNSETEIVQIDNNRECDVVNPIVDEQHIPLNLDVDHDNSRESEASATDFDTDNSSEQEILTEDEYSDDVIEIFETLISQWAVNENISHSAVSGLLKILKTHDCHFNLPKDPRTLLNTPRSTIIKTVPPGLYWHLGLRTVLNQYIEECGEDLSLVDTLYLKIGIDGLPLSRSSNSALWPILCSVNSSDTVYLIGAYHGEQKPYDANIYLEDFVNEAVDLIESGLTHNEKNFHICLHKIVCDAPAKAFILNVKNHTGYSSCTKCIVEGEYRDRRVCFPDIRAPKRTDLDFRNHTDENYHLVYSILETIPNFGPVTNIILDFLHLGCYGAMKKLMNFFVSGDLKVRLPHRKCNVISQRLKDIRPAVPTEFVRKPRSLQYLKQWKATEFRQLLLYTGPVVLKSVLSRELYDHFITLHVSFRILCCPTLSKDYLNYTQELLDHFVLTFKRLYGEHNISHNIHNLIHLPAEVKNFGPLDSFSAFKYENFMQILKKLIRKSDKPLQQLSRRYTEMKRHSKVKGNRENKNDLEPQVRLSHPYHSTILPNGNNPQYKRLKYMGYTFEINNVANDSCELSSGIIIRIENIVQDSTRNALVVIGKEYLETADLFTKPCASSLVDIFVVSKLSLTKLWPASMIRRKIFLIPYSNNKSVAVPLIHVA